MAAKKHIKQHSLRGVTLTRFGDKCIERANVLHPSDPSQNPTDDIVHAAAAKALAEIGAIAKALAKSERRLR